MGYDLHITRAENHFESETNPITREEWERYVAGDSDLQVDTDNTDTVIIPPLDDAPLWYQDDGYISTKNPETDVIKKMVEIAAALNAKVQGDDGEWYFPDGQVYETEYLKTADKQNLFLRILSFFCCKPKPSEVKYTYTPTGGFKLVGRRWLDE